VRLLAYFVVLSLLGATGCASNESGHVPLTRFALGDIGGWLELPIEANDKPSRWLLDTGSNRNLVSAAFAREQGLETQSPVTATTALGQVQGAEVQLPTLRLGALERSRQTALVVDLSLIVGAGAEWFDGVLGAPFLDNYVLDLDLRNWTFAMHRNNRASCPQGMYPLALGLHQGLPVIDVVVNDGHTESVLLDTGNPAGLVRIVAKLPADSASDSAQLRLARRVSIGQQIRHNVPLVQIYSPSLKRALGPRVEGVVGTALLDGARWQIDQARRQVCVEAGSFVVPGGFGMTLEQRDGDLYIGMVLPGGPAQQAGLQPGDIVQQWVSKPPEGDLSDLWSRVQGLDEIELVVGDEGLPLRLRRAYFAPQLP